MTAMAPSDAIKQLLSETSDEFESPVIEVALSEAGNRMQLADKNFARAGMADITDDTRSLLLATALLHEQRATNLLALVTLERNASRLA